MLYQASTSRPLINMLEYPEHVVIFTLRRHGISTGLVQLDYLAGFETGMASRVVLEYTRQVSIEGSTREVPFDVLEYVLPFWDLADTHGRRSATGGFNVSVRSAFRQGSQYGEREASFWVSFPLNGGGIVRFPDVGMDIANPTLNPRALLPPEGPEDETIRDTLREEGDITRTSTRNISIAYNRVHTNATPASLSAAARLRASRIANFNLEEEGLAGEFGETTGSRQATAEAQDSVLHRIDRNQHTPQKHIHRLTRFERMDELMDDLED